MTKTGSQVSLSLVASQMPPWLLPAMAGGVLMGLSAPPAALPVTVLPGLVLLLRSMRRTRSHQNPALPVFVAMSLSWGLAYAWVGTHVMPTVAWTSVFVLASLICVMSAAATAGYRTAGPFGLITGLLAAEMMLTYGPISFPWISPGFSVYGTFLESIPAWMGITGTSALLLGSAGVLEAILTRWTPTLRTDIWIAAGSIMLGALLTLWVPSPPRSRDVHPNAVPSVRVALVQPGMIPEKWADIADASRTLKLSRLSATATDAVLHVWPETALPQRTIGSIVHLSDQFLVPPGSALIAGAILHPPNANDSPYNASVFIPRRGAPTWIAKRKLVPFAEYVPGEDLLPFMDMMRVRAGGVSGYAAGLDRHVFEVAGIPFTTLICFESVFAREARMAVQAGAEFLVVQTQDGWWTSDRAWQQHQAHTSLVASSVGRPVAVSSVSGWTGLIGSDGHIRDELPPGAPGVRVVDVQPVRTMTGYLYMGEWPAWGIFVILIVCAAVSRYRDPTFRSIHPRFHQSP